MKRKVRWLMLLVALVPFGLLLNHARTQRTNQSVTQPAENRPTVLVSNGFRPVVDLSGLIRQADVIVVARAFNLTDLGRTTDQSQTDCAPCGPQHQLAVTLHIKRLIYGQPQQSDLTVKYLVGEQPNGKAEYSELVDSDYRLFFLKSGDGQNYLFADQYYPFLVALNEPPAEMLGGTPYDRAVAEITNVLVSPTASSDNRIRAVSSLEFAKTRQALLALRKASEDPDVRVRYYSMASLFRHNDITKINDGVDVLLHRAASLDRSLVDTLRAGIDVGVRDPGAIPALDRLLKSPNPEDRRSAVGALNRMGPGGRALLTKALDDDDQKVRFAAVTGLATVTGETDGMPSLELFQKDELHYLNHWRERMKKKN